MVELKLLLEEIREAGAIDWKARQLNGITC
jgi:hypothetical protein